MRSAQTQPNWGSNRLSTDARKKSSSKERIAKHRQRLAESGLKRVEVWVKPEQSSLIQEIAGHLRSGAVISVSPPTRMDDPEIIPLTKEKMEMETLSTPWTVASLKQALESSEELLPGEFVCDINEGATPVLTVSVEAAGGVILYVAIQDEQIVTSTILWPRDEQEDPAAFEAMMLRSHKICLPLCAVSIDVIDGREYYELFGSMSSRSSLGNVVYEFRTIANNALELAQDLHPSRNVA